MSSKPQQKINEKAGLASENDENFIVERIYKAVMEQRLAPKTKLSEASLCEAFGVGRMHVRRALLLLSAQGIVDLRSNRGAYIACPDKKEAQDVFRTRMLVEPPLVRELADGASDKTLALLASHITREDQARKENERTDLIRLSGEFHVLLAIAAGNEVAAQIVRELVMRSSLIVGLFGRDGHGSCPDDEHKKILDAIQERDAKRAEMQVINHLRHIQAGLNMDERREPRSDLVTLLNG